MPLPAPLSRANAFASKKDFGHVLIIAGSRPMLGAAALCSLAAMRSGAGLVTVAVPQGLNLSLQKKISNVVMTKPLVETKQGSFSFKAYHQLKKDWEAFDAVAVGPGLGREPGTQRLIRQIIIHCPRSLVVDADALFALAGHTEILLKAKAPRVLTPHAGEMARLIGYSFKDTQAMRSKVVRDFERRYPCVLLLKGHRSVVASRERKAYINKTGNVGMATAGSGDVLTGMIAAFLGQGMDPFDAVQYAAYYHGKAGDAAARCQGKVGMIAEDIINHLKECYED